MKQASYRKFPRIKTPSSIGAGEPEDATNVTWAMQGDTPYFARIIHVFIDMDSMVGKDFEAGLASLKAIAEK